MRKRKKATREHNPGRGKKKAVTDPKLISPRPVLRWSVAKLDVDGQWGWNRVNCQFFLSHILPKMQSFESMTWNDILGTRHHEVSIQGIGTEAKKRLAKLNLDDVENLVSFALTGRQRLWGIRLGDVFQILWWDPNHEVYPSPSIRLGRAKSNLTAEHSDPKTLPE